MSVLDIFKPPPHTKEIKDPKIVRKKYTYWRIRTFYSMYIGYAFFYVSRKSFTLAIPAMVAELGLSKVQIGNLGSILSLTYGASKFFSGIMSDRSNPRYFMSIGLILTGVFNLFFGFSNSYTLFAMFWGLNGWFQGWGWPPCGKLLTHWYSQSERGRWWSIWNTSHNVGALLIVVFGSYVVQYLGWRLTMDVPGIACIVMGIFLINRLRDTPRSLGLPTIEEYKKDYPSKKHEKSRYQLSTKEILFKYVLNNKYIWILAVAYFFVYLIRQAVNEWTNLFLVESKGVSYLLAGSSLLFFEIGGLIGSLAAGWSSDYLFKGKRGPVNVLFTLGVVVTLFLMRKTPGGLLIVDFMYVFLIGFFIFGPQMLIGVAAAELSHKKAVGTATGLIGWIAYIGAAVAGGPLGALISKYGWDGYYIILSVCAIAALLFLLPLWKIKTNPALEEEK